MKNTIYILLMFLLGSCGDILDSKLKVVNKTNYTVSIDYRFETDDTLFNVFDIYISDSIRKNDTFPIQKFGKNSWMLYLQNSKSQCLNIYFYYTDSLKKNKYKYKSMYRYFLDHNYFKAIKLTEKQLDSCHWIVNVKN